MNGTRVCRKFLFLSRSPKIAGCWAASQAATARHGSAPSGTEMILLMSWGSFKKRRVVRQQKHTAPSRKQTFFVYFFFLWKAVQKQKRVLLSSFPKRRMKKQQREPQNLCMFVRILANYDLALRNQCVLRAHLLLLLLSVTLALRRRRLRPGQQAQC